MHGTFPILVPSLVSTWSAPDLFTGLPFPVPGPGGDQAPVDAGARPAGHVSFGAVNKQDHCSVNPVKGSSDLLRRARAGDIGAFCEGFEPHRIFITRLASRLVGPDDAGDVAMETFLKAWQALPRFRGDSGLRTWLCRIARNCALDMLRRRKRGFSDTGEAGDGDGRGAARSQMDQWADVLAFSPSDIIERHETSQMLERAMSALGDVHRLSMELRYSDGLSYREIAAATGVSIGTVMSRLFVARHRVRRWLVEQGVRP